MSGQKLGLAVSITSVGEARGREEQREEQVKEGKVKEEPTNIKTEPEEVRELFRAVPTTFGLSELELHALRHVCSLNFLSIVILVDVLKLILVISW